MRLILILYFGLFTSAQAFSQTDDNSIESMKAYVRTIDSLIRIKTKQTRLVIEISEGSIQRAKKRKVKRRGFSRTTVTSSDRDTVYLIQQHDNLEKNLYQSYYYKSDKLVFSRIEVQDDDDKNVTLFLQEEYYNDDKVIMSTISKNALKKKYQWRTDFNHMANGYAYLTDFKKG